MLNTMFSPAGEAPEMRGPATCQALHWVHSLIKTEISYFDTCNARRGMWEMCLHSLKSNERMHSCAHPTR